jgi:nucleotide-binding universal stress UspA family protein
MMPAIRRILCPLDFSPFSRHALAQGVALAREFGAEISALHVFALSPVVQTVPAGGYMGIDPLSLSASRRAALTAELREFTYEVDAGGVVMHAGVDEGDPVDVIVKAAADWPADLIVMGTHGRTGLGRLLLGSVTERVLRRATCPVLTVPRQVESPACALTLGRLLVAVDFSPASLHALEYAAKLAAPEGPGICVLNVVELFGATRELATLDTPDFRVELVRAARTQLAAAVPPAMRANYPVAEIVATGRACDEIVRVAAEEECDAIVLGIRGRSRTDLLLLGSTTQHVVRQAQCPVLTVRA